MNRISFIALLFVSTISTIVFSADENKDEALATLLKKKYENADFALLKHTTTIEFAYSGSKKNLTVTEYNEREIIALNGGNTYFDHVFYNTFSDNLGAKASNMKGKGLLQSTKCGSYETEGIFYDDVKACFYGTYASNMGDKFKTDTEKRYNDPRFFDKLFFHSEYPVEKREVIIKIPDWVKVDVKSFNTGLFNVKSTETYDAKKKLRIVTYTASDLEAMRTGKLKGGSVFDHPHLLAIVRKFENKGVSTEVFTSPKALYKWYHEIASQTQNKPEELKGQVAKLTQGLTSDVEKIKAIYYWVQDNVRYIAFEDGLAGFRPEAADKVYANKYGDCKGMANLTKEMLKIAGYDARLTWIGTKELPYTHDIASLSTNNHMICTVFLNGKHYFLDATEKYCDLGDYAERIQGKEVVIENGTNYILDTIPVIPKERNLQKATYDLTVSDDKLMGKANVIYKGETKAFITNLANQVTQKKKGKLVDILVSMGDKNINVNNAQSNDLEKRNSEVNIKAEVDIHNRVSLFGEDLYLDLNIFKEYKDNKLDTSRYFDYNIHQKVLNESSVSVKIPAGYKVKHLPKNISVKNKEFTVLVEFNKSADKVTLKKTFVIEKGLISKKNFPEWNKVVKQLQETYNDQVVLVKQ